MQEDKKQLEEMVSEYDEAYRHLIKESMDVTDKEFETFIISLVM
ncbi:MAG: hypothetical protein RR614_03050 [Eubacterium sp.]